MKHNCELNLKNQKGSAIHLALKEQQISILNFLIDNYFDCIDFSIQDSLKNTVLHDLIFLN